MAVSKFYAVAKTIDGKRRVVNAFEALRLADEDPWDYPVDKVEGVFHDLETDLKVFPSRGRTSRKTHKRGQPYFSYFSGESSPLKGEGGSFTYTPELIAFLSAFEAITKFQIQENDTEIVIFPDKIAKLQRVTFSDGGYSILKFYMKLDETYPYSAYYKFNGVLAIEFYVSGKPSRLKRAELARMGVPLFEAKAFFPKWIQEKLPKEFDAPEQLAKLAREIRITYQDRNYKLFGHFKRDHLIKPDYERKYQILKDFEDQKAELENDVKQLKEDCETKDAELRRLREEIAQAEKRLQKYCQKEECCRKLIVENEALTTERKELVSSKQALERESENQKKTIETLRKRGFWKRLFNL